MSPYLTKQEGIYSAILPIYNVAYNRASVFSLQIFLSPLSSAPLEVLIAAYCCFATPSMSTPAMSTLATWCHDVHSRDFSRPILPIKMQKQVVIPKDVLKAKAYCCFATPSMSTPAMSTLATWCRDVHSRDVHPCIFDRATMSTPAISVAPFYPSKC